MAGPALYGEDLFGDAIQPQSRGAISDRFTVPPFTVLNTREGFWQERKRAWCATGIKGEIGRDAKTYNVGDWMADKGGGSRGEESGLSIFDPVLTELCYQWFCPPAGQIVDPFAGGSVRGIVAALLGYHYWGCDLRREQVDANREQAEAIVPDNAPDWQCRDAMDMLGYPDMLAPCPAADFVFSCPPYGDLERYSDNPRDLSTMEYHTFTAAYRRVIQRACSCLKDDRFACFVVGDFRDKRGHYRGFVAETIAAFREQGLELYNEAILVNAVGSLPVRITKQFDAGRKLGKCHQNVLVFVKGDWRKAASAITQEAAQ
jgi:hypothetical protein